MLELAHEQQPGVGRQDPGDCDRARVRTVRRAEGVVHVEVAALGELAREALVVLRLARVEACVLEHLDALVGEQRAQVPAHRVDR